MSMELNKANECTCPSGDGSLVHPCPAHPAVEQVGGDERAAFEAAFAAMGRPVCRADYDQDAYGTPFDDGGWTGWQARAALAQPSLAHELDPLNLAPHAEAFNEAPAEVLKPEQAERPEVVAYRTIGRHEKHQHPHYALNYYKQNAEDQAHWRERGCEVSEDELMTVAQHERIVGVLRAEIAEWQEAAGRSRSDVVAYIAERAKLLEERDAALAEVERLRESKGDPVGSLEKCMKVMYERDEHAKRLEVALARVAELEGKLTDWVHEGFRLNEALAVAKAQHSVPDDDMILQIFADNAEHSEQGDEHGYCIVREQHAQAIARKLLAAAPGNSAQHSVPEGLALIPVRETEAMHDAVMALLYKGVARTDTQKLLDAYIAAAPGKEVGHE